MNFQLAKQILETDLKPLQKLLLYGLAYYSSKDCICWPSHDSLQKRTGLSRRTIIRLLSQFEKLGIVEKRKRTNRSGNSCVYFVHLPVSESHIESDSVTHRECQRDTLRVTESHIESDRESHKVIQEQIQEVIQESYIVTISLKREKNLLTQILGRAGMDIATAEAQNAIDAWTRAGISYLWVYDAVTELESRKKTGYSYAYLDAVVQDIYKQVKDGRYHKTYEFAQFLYCAEYPDDSEKADEI